MTDKPTKIYKLNSPDGRAIRVKYFRKAFSGVNLKDNSGNSFNYRFDKFEFLSKVTSETGYHSLFASVEYDYEPTKAEMFDYLRTCIEEFSGTKYGKPTQQMLLT